MQREAAIVRRRCNALLRTDFVRALEARPPRQILHKLCCLAHRGFWHSHPISPSADSTIMMIQRLLALLTLLAATLILSGCGYNDFQRLDEQSKAAWSEVLNQYQRRADLVPNIVATVKGEAAFEQETLTKVIEARAKATSIQVTPELLNNPEAFNKFQQAQGELSSALSRLMVVSERYPDLKSNQNFLSLQSQLEGTENRISVARRDFIQAVERYNTEIRTFPGRLWHAVMYSDLPIRPTFEATAPDADKAPEVKF